MANTHDPYSAEASYNRPDDRPNVEEAHNKETVAYDSLPVTEPVAVVETPQYDVPEGSISVVLDWVGSDKGKAQAALDAEHKADKPRKTLIEKLEELV